MLSGKDDFFYKDDLDAVLAIIDAYMFENDKDMESDNLCPNLPSRENCSFKCQTFVYPKQIYQGTRKQNTNSTLT